MNIFKPANRLIAGVISLVMLATPLLAQQRRNAPRKPPVPEPAPTFDSLLAAESYKIYCEIRGVGGLVRSSAVNDLLDPIMKLGGPPKEFKTVVKWLNAHADVLAGSRMMVAGWGSRPNLPNVLIAIEFASPEEAKKFYPELRDFLPKILPTPTPSPIPAQTPTTIPAAQPAAAVAARPSETQVVRTELVGAAATTQNIGTAAEKEPEPSLPPYQMKQAGSLVLISDTAFTFKSLRPRGSKALEEDQNFLLARNRFSSESLFLYVDLKTIEKEEKAQRQKWEDEAQKHAEAEQKRAEEAAANPPTVEEPVTETTDPELSAVPVEEQVMPPEPPPSEPSTVVSATVDPQAPGNAQLSSGPQPSVEEAVAFSSLSRIFFAGESKWPEAVGAALVFEGDAYVLRTLIINSPENKGIAIPFVPQLVSGPAIAPESPNIFPADVDLFASVSLDYPQIYEGLLKALADSDERQRKYAGPYERRSATSGPPETPFAFYEKKLGLKIKDDLLPLLGNELALALPKKAKKTTNDAATSSTVNPPTGESVQQNAAAGPNPLIAIAVKDREAVGRLIPKIIEGLGLKGASLLAQTEKRDGTEIVSYAGVFSYAFVGDFLVLSPDPAETRHVVDAYLNHQTLSSDSHFRNYTRWQPRQVLGQLYMAPGLVAEYTVGSGKSGAALDKMNAFFSGVNPVIDPLTYSLSNDGLGPLHELHLPKNLLQVLVAEMLVGASESVPSSNEAIARGLMQSLANAEATFKSTEGNSGYGTLEQLVSAGLFNAEMLEKYGYRIEVSASPDKFQITAVPTEYGTTGKLSFFIDESQILRGGDHGGGAATADDQPM
ncbi:MAG TPA: DUF3352 domain-containing protein [Pyrinomonadaceae bacterium]|nr:DUF3352 domain-containing protein [Pyrinomonadaceae bacterium]